MTGRVLIAVGTATMVGMLALPVGYHLWYVVPWNRFTLTNATGQAVHSLTVTVCDRTFEFGIVPCGGIVSGRFPTPSQESIFVIHGVLEDGTRFDDGGGYVVWEEFGVRCHITMRPDGTGIRRLTTAPGNDSHQSWSPDGKHILWSSGRYGFKDEAALYDNAFQPFAQIFMMNADGSDQHPLTRSRWEDSMPALVPPSAQKRSQQ